MLIAIAPSRLRATGAEPGVKRVHALRVVPAFWSRSPAIVDADAFDNEHSVLRLDLPHRLRFVTLVIHFDLTRLQRAGKRAVQSPPSRRHHVVEVVACDG